MRRRATIVILGCLGCGPTAVTDDGSGGGDSGSSGVTSTSTSTSQGEGSSTTAAVSTSSTGTSSAADSSSGGPGVFDVSVAACEGYRNVADGVYAQSQGEVDDAAGVECIRGALVLGGGADDPIVDLSPLAQLQWVGDDLVLEQLTLTDLQGLSALAWLDGEIVVGGETVEGGCVINPGLQRLDGLGALTHVQGLRVCGDGDATPLQSIDGASAALVGELGRVWIVGAPQLDAILALDEVTRIDDLVLSALPGLASLDGLETLTTAVHVELTEVGITDLCGLGALVGVENGVTLDRNPQLSSLAGADALTHVGSIIIRDNPMLPQADAEAFVATLDVDNGAVVCGNLGGDPCP